MVGTVQRESAFAERVARARAWRGPLVLGLDPATKTLSDWDLPDSPQGLERFVDIALAAAAQVVGMVKPQSAFYERHGWPGLRCLHRLITEARSSGLLVVLDVKRGDIGSTNEAYADAYLGTDAAMAVDAVTVTPYLGVDALRPFFEQAQSTRSGVFVVTRSSNDDGRDLQQAVVQGQGETVEGAIVAALAAENHRVAPDGIGPFGSVFAAAHGPTMIDLAAMGGLFLCPGVGEQGTTPLDVAACFASCPDRVLPCASRALLAQGPDPGALVDAVARLGDELHGALAATGP
jgi:orotidine-5'-phosphate decarboxylase